MEHRAILWMGKSNYVEKKQVQKNNGINLISLIMKGEEDTIVPSIYLNDYFKQYEDGKDMDRLWEELMLDYMIAKESSKTQLSDLSYTYENMKESIIYRMVNYEKNKEMLQLVPHLKILDFAITFHCLVRNDTEGIGTIRITEEHCEQWEVTTKELYLQAMKNTPNIFPAVIRPMEEIMRELMKKEMMDFHKQQLQEDISLDEQEKEAEQAANDFIELLQHDDSKRNLNMYVLSNTKGINGAGCLLYPDVLSGFASKIDNDLFVLPSSIHELILVPYEESLGIYQLKEMVKEINQTQVPAEEVLSDAIYCYSKSKGNITLM